MDKYKKLKKKILKTNTCFTKKLKKTI